MPIDAVLVGARGTGSANTATTTGGTTAASGSTFLICVSWDEASYGSITTVGDNKGNTYTALGTPQTDAGVPNCFTQLFVVENGAGGAGHTATFTTSGNSFPTVHLIEITGATTAPLDKIAQVRDTATPFTVTSPTLSQADEVVVCICAENSSSVSYVSSNFTILSQETDAVQFWTSAVGKLVVSSTSAVTPNWTRGAGGSAGLALATFKAQASIPDIMGQAML